MRLWTASLVLVLALGTACGAGAPPAESEIWYAANLRPGVELAATPGEELLLGRLASLPANESIQLEGQVFTASTPYVAASGRTCRRISIETDATPRRRLACDDSEGRWVFVPNPFPAEAP